MTDIGTKAKQKQQVVQAKQAGAFWTVLQKVTWKNLEQDGLSSRYYDTAWDGRLLLVPASLDY